MSSTACTRATLLVLWIDVEALRECDLPLLAAQPALRFVESSLDLSMLARDARGRDPRALPDMVVIHLGDRRAEAVLELRFRRPQVVPLLL
jgi:hypothetical protein